MIRITELPPKKCTREDIAAFEATSGVVFPRDYSAFLLETNGGYCGTADDGTRSTFEFNVGPKRRIENGDLAVMYSLGLGETKGTVFGDLAIENEKCRTCDFPIPPGMVAIGHTIGSWTIALGIANRFRDGVYIMIEGHGYRWGDVLVATSFAAFNRMVRQEAD